MIEWLGSIVQYSHNIGIIVFVIIIEGIKEDSKTIPTVWWAENISIVIAFTACIPYGLPFRVWNDYSKASLTCYFISENEKTQIMPTHKSVSSNTSTARYSEYNLDCPPIEWRLFFRPNGTLLTLQRWCNTNTFRTGNSILSA